jgi:gamma-glutamyltranspeptidase/glutathione hydrolase
MRLIAQGIAAALLLGGVLVGAPTFAQQASDTLQPEIATRQDARAPVAARRHMVITAHPLASEAGLRVLRDGGSAADALVAVQLVLGLVEPQSSGLGGGAFLLWYDAATRKLTSFDGRETAPLSATPDLFRKGDGSPLGFFEAVVGGRSVGVPGVPALLETVHRRFGKQPWRSLFAAPIRLAEEGFVVSPRMAASIAADAGRMAGEESMRAYFMDAAGLPLPAGHLLKNPAYARTLRSLAADGMTPFYRGAIAARIVAAVNGHAGNPGTMTADDLAIYRVKERPAVCAPYRGFDVCGMGPPSSGGIAVAQILGMLEPYDLAALGPLDPESWRLIGDATRLAFSDRGLYLADPDFVSIPAGLTNRAYLAQRSQLLRRPTALGEDEAGPGEPPWDRTELRIDAPSLERPSTTHVVIVDDDGNVASMTSSIENAFGARIMVDGFLLNNQLTDFAFMPVAEGVNVANRVEPGKRPRSSMAPTIVLRDGEPAFAVGSPGGSAIIGYVANALVAMIDWRMDPQAAVSSPHLLNRFGIYELEAGTPAAELADDLSALGFKTEITDLNSGLHAIAWTAAGLAGGADQRREGLALGD